MTITGRAVWPLRLIFSLLVFTFIACDHPRENTGLPLVVLTFDDEHLSQYTVALPLLSEHGWSGTAYVYSASMGNPYHLSWEQARVMHEAGWEFGGHTVDHVCLPDCSDAEALYQIGQNYRDICDSVATPVSFAYPSGLGSNRDEEILTRYYHYLRNSKNQYNLPGTVDRLNLGYFSYRSEYTATAAINRLLQSEQMGEELVILGFHSFENNDGNMVTNCVPAEMEKIVDFIAGRGYRVLTLQQAMQELGL